MREALRGKDAARLRAVLFPQHAFERDDVYDERLARLFYIPYMGQIVSHMVASLFADPVEMQADGEVDPFYDLFFNDVSPPGASKVHFHQLLRTQIARALLMGSAWALVDLPAQEQSDDGTERLPPSSLADQEADGMLRAYAVPLEPESVLDWECDSEGELEWALVHGCYQRRPDVFAGRSVVREEWTHYTRGEWTRWFVEYDAEREQPNPDEPVKVLRPTAPHSFGRVPLVRLCLPEDLWVGGKLEAIATAHLNLRAGLTWGEVKGLFQFLAVKVGPTDPLVPVTEDTGRATNQVIGPGRVVVLGKDDAIGYVAPDAAPFEIAMRDLANLRDEMFRVVHHMAQTIDNSGAALQRSGDSKQADQAATAIVLKHLGQRLKEHAVDLYEMVGLGRQDPLTNWHAKGFDSFQEETLEKLIAEETELEGISVPSATFQVERKRRLAARKLGDDVDPALMDQIEAELKANITNESFQRPGPTEPGVDGSYPPQGAEDGQQPGEKKPQ